MPFGFSFRNPFKNLNLDNVGSSVLGIDIGASSIKAVQLRKEKERAVLETYGEIATGPFANLKVGQATKLSAEKTAEALRDLVREANVKAVSAVVAIPLKSSFVTTISLPAEMRDTISEVLPMEARRYIPVPISEVVLDWWIMPESGGHPETMAGNGPGTKKTMKVLLVAIHRDVIDLYKNILAQAKLTAKAYEIESFASIRSSLQRETGPVAVVDIGASTTKVSVVDYGIIRHSHLIDRGSQEITLALSQALSVPFETAENMKREKGFSKNPEDKEIVSVMEPAMDFIAYEAINVIRDYERRDRHAVGRVIVSGGGVLLPGVMDFLVKKFNLEVSSADPFSKTAYAPIFESVLKRIGSSFSVAVGLALRDI